MQNCKTPTNKYMFCTTETGISFRLMVLNIEELRFSPKCILNNELTNALPQLILLIPYASLIGEKTVSFLIY